MRWVGHRGAGEPRSSCRMMMGRISRLRSHCQWTYPSGNDLVVLFVQCVRNNVRCKALGEQDSVLRPKVCAWDRGDKSSFTLSFSRTLSPTTGSKSRCIYDVFRIRQANHVLIAWWQWKMFGLLRMLQVLGKVYLPSWSLKQCTDHMRLTLIKNPSSSSTST